MYGHHPWDSTYAHISLLLWVTFHFVENWVVLVILRQKKNRKILAGYNVHVALWIANWRPFVALYRTRQRSFDSGTIRIPRLRAVTRRRERFTANLWRRQHKVRHNPGPVHGSMRTKKTLNSPNLRRKESIEKEIEASYGSTSCFRLFSSTPSWYTIKKNKNTGRTACLHWAV